MTSKPTTGALPEVDALADAFIRDLRAVIGEEKFKVVCAGERDPDDFCDANMVMDAAFKSLGFDPLPDIESGMSQATADRWNAAWRRAVEKMQAMHADTLNALSAELNAYLASKGIPAGSADEILLTNKTLGADVRAWLVDFCKRWDRAQEGK